MHGGWFGDAQRSITVHLNIKLWDIHGDGGEQSKSDVVIKVKTTRGKCPSVTYQSFRGTVRGSVLLGQ